MFKILVSIVVHLICKEHTGNTRTLNKLGPVGLRSALEAQLLGARTVIVERRPKFTRNNVLKLWKFLIDDLKLLGKSPFSLVFI